MAASVVLNGAKSSARVSEATRVRIMKAAAVLGYRRNVVAISLARKLVDTIGVVAVIDGGELNLYILEVLNGILEGAASNGQNVTVLSIPNWSEPDRVLQFCDGRVDGLIMIAPYEVPPAFSAHIQRHTPYVTIHGSVPDQQAYDLNVDNEGGARMLVEHLISAGHRQIGYLAGWERLLDVQQRITGYRRALEGAGIEVDESLIFPGQFSIASGKQRMKELIQRQDVKPLPTAIFCASDAIAYGCMEALGEAGFKVPYDISIVGFDDSFLARMTSPPLTTVRQPLRRMGRRSVEKLLPLIRSDFVLEEADGDRLSSRIAVHNPFVEIYPVELVIRDSVGPPPRK